MTLLCVQHRNAVTSGNIPPRVRGREREQRPNLQRPGQFLSGVRSGTDLFCHFYEAVTRRKPLLAGGDWLLGNIYKVNWEQV